MLVCVAASGCGFKGALYLPEKSEVTIRPGSAATAPATPAEPTAPQQGPAEPKPPAPPEQTPPTGTGRG